ncbi:hypothetical protein VP01_1610g1 [Puccinia sorghi]|uniref:Uncharacterized protein n=1 Tax=Puccinia sorghi TaxID=27349 RepID=A0A0L6VIZ3_9BASI|nr:hypothetical protein VP01_1610g1 [Puccinia sorghi]
MWQPTTFATDSSLTAQKKQEVEAAVQARTQKHEAMLAMLIEEVCSSKASRTVSQPNTTQPTTPKEATRKAHKNSKTSQDTTSMSTPKRTTGATSAPAEVGNPKARKSPKDSKSLAVTKVPSPQRHPQQMQSVDIPSEFTSTKNAPFIHIKILPGLLKQDLVPSAPDLQTLQEFYQRFTNNNQINQAVKMSSSPALINLNEVQLFQDTTQGSIQLGRQIIHVGSNNIRYAQVLMVRFALGTWCPNLKEDSGSFYNAAHWIDAITTFQERVVIEMIDC